jgi:uncharacterized surface protein with fasciclin (FAS1) repeats
LRNKKKFSKFALSFNKSMGFLKRKLKFGTLFAPKKINLNKLFMKKSLLLLSALLIFSCTKDNAPFAQEEPPAPGPALKTITQLAESNPDLSSFVIALKKTGLDKTLNEPGTYTVFAPSNAAMLIGFGTSFPDASFHTKESLSPYLLNGMLIVKKKAADLKTEYVSTMAPGVGDTKLSMYVDLVTNAGIVTLNGNAKVTTPDIEASNGVIHLVDKVIYLPTLVDALAANPKFKTLVATLTNSAQAATKKVLEDASAARPLTVLAPNDNAFETAFWARNATQAQLTTVLQYHVVAGNVLSTSLTNSQEVTTVGTQKLYVEKTPSAVLFEDVNAGRAKIIEADIQCSNGIIHAVNSVLQPKL